MVGNPATGGDPARARCVTMARDVSDQGGVADPMSVVAIHLGAPQNPRLWTVESVQAVAGKGLEGDRHFDPTGAPPGGALTLVEEEIVDEVGLPPGGTRRQLTVRGNG